MPEVPIYDIEVEKINKTPSNSGFVSAHYSPETGTVVFKATNNKSEDVDKDTLTKLIKV